MLLGMMFLLVVAFVCLDTCSCLLAASSADGTGEPRRREFLERMREGEKGYFGNHYYWYNGLHIVSAEKNVRLRVRAQMMYDVGYIFAKEDLENHVSNTDEFQSDVRRLEVWGWGTLYDAIEFKISANGTGSFQDAEIKQFGAGKGGHDLLKLAGQVGFFEGDGEAVFSTESDFVAMRDILKGLTEAVLWGGRYPIPKHSSGGKVDIEAPAKVHGHYMRDWLDPFLDHYQKI